MPQVVRISREKSQSFGRRKLFPERYYTARINYFESISLGLQYLHVDYTRCSTNELYALPVITLQPIGHQS